MGGVIRLRASHQKRQKRDQTREAMIVDRQILYAKISKLLYRMTYSTGLVRSPVMKKFENLARKQKPRLLAPDDALICLPKKGVIKIGEAVPHEDTVLAPQVVEHFIEQSSYRAIMEFCLCRDSNRCKDYPHDLGCLFIGETAKGIHPSMAKPATKDEARAHIRKAREAGLINIVGKASMDCVWLGIGPHHRLFTVCSCCPCCCISLAAQYMPPDFTDWFHKMPGVSTHIDNEACVGCGICLEACIYNGIVLKGDCAVITDSCRACGRCTEVCPQKAIRVSIDDENFIQKTIDFLKPRVDVS